MATNAKKAVEFTIVGRIMALLNLGEEGQLTSFFTKIKKQSENDIKKLKSNLAKDELDHKIDLDKIEDQIEDAQIALENAYTSVDLERIKTNADQISYMENYLHNIKNLESALERLQTRKTELVDSYKDKVKANEESIKKIETKLTKIFN